MLTNKHIALTGATGFIGSHLLPLLLQSGATVTCLVRERSKTENLPEGVRIETVDLLRGTGLAQALAGQDAFIHLAALLFSCHWKNYLHANTGAAQTICSALTHLGEEAPKKVVLISSMAATGPSKPDTPVTDETAPHPVSAYGWSKLLVERTFQSSYKGDLTILRPSIVYGSGDRGLLPVFRGARFGFCVSPGFGRTFPISCIHGSDMAKAICCALTGEKTGIYHVSDGKNYTMDSFCTALCAALSVKPRILHLPLPLLAATAHVATLFGRLFIRHGRSPNWNSDKYAEAREAGWLCDSSRLTRDFGFTPSYSLEQGMQESVAGYRKRGWL